jgi:PLP dependent protein
MRPERRNELAERLETVRERIRAAAAKCPGGRAEPELIVVTKYFPASDVALLSGLGVRSVGENRDQEAAAKAEELSGLDLEWHFIGQLQSNKAKSVVRYAHAIHSVDRGSLVKALAKAMKNEQQRRSEEGLPAREALRCLVQVDLEDRSAENDDDAGHHGTARGGADPADVLALAGLIDAAEGLEFGGLMAVAPLGADPAAAFGRLAALAAQVQARYPAATDISAGMSGDLEEAVLAGATHLRVGSDVLGPRPPLR